MRIWNNGTAADPERVILNIVGGTLSDDRTKQATTLTLSTLTAGLTVTGGALSLTGNAASTVTTSSGALTVDSAAALNLGTSAATSVSVAASGVATTVNGNLSVGAKYTVGVSGGTLSTYNNEATAGNGQAYIVAVGQDVASSGAGAQSTTVATFTPATSGVYRVAMVISAHTNTDTVSMQVTFTDAVMSFATTLTPISSVALTHDANSGTTSASVIVRASTATAIVCKISASTQTTTLASAVIERLN